MKLCRYLSKNLQRIPIALVVKSMFLRSAQIKAPFNLASLLPRSRPTHLLSAPLHSAAIPITGSLCRGCTPAPPGLAAAHRLFLEVLAYQRSLSWPPLMKERIHPSTSWLLQIYLFSLIFPHLINCLVTHYASVYRLCPSVNARQESRGMRRGYSRQRPQSLHDPWHSGFPIITYWTKE